MNVDEIFSAALELEPADRTAYVEEACGDDDALRRRVAQLIDAHDTAGDFLETPALGSEIPEGAAATEPPGTRIGPYRILDVLGEGGFGVVYLAEQLEPVRRKVALKVLKLGMDTRQVIARFEAERQALALTDHPNIAKILDAGATETGRPYFVMELVRGVSICEYADENRLPIRARLELFVDVCRAIQHAHQKGLVHRDLKPGNVMVTLQDGRPITKVIDFGVAKATNQRLGEGSVHTQFGQFIGTPVYMSPEQAALSGVDVDTRTDIYALGVLLYELLTGKTPFAAKRLREAGLAEVQLILREEEPPAPSARIARLDGELAEIARLRGTSPEVLKRICRRDLDWIVLKAIEKEPARRYDSAQGLGDDIGRYLVDQPVVAGPPSALYQLRKFVRRNRVVVVAGTAIVAALVIGVTLAIGGLLKASEEARTSRRISAFLQDMFASVDPDATHLDAESLLSEAREVFGDDHAAVAGALRGRALQLMSMGELDEAEPLLREALRIWSDLAEDHANVGVTHGRLGVLYRMMGREREAEDHLADAIRLGEAAPGGAGPPLCEAYDELAGLLAQRGDYEEAERLLRTSIEVRTASAPEDRFQISKTQAQRIEVLALSGRNAEAELAWKEKLDDFEHVYPKGSVFIARERVLFAGWLMTWGRVREAEAAARAALAYHRKNPSVQRESYLMALEILYDVLKGQPEQPVEIDALILETTEVGRGVWPADSLRLAEQLELHAGALDRYGSHDEALGALMQARRIYENAQDREVDVKQLLPDLLNQVWQVVIESGSEREKYTLARSAVELILEESPGKAEALSALATVQYRLGRYEEARLSLGAVERSETPEGAGLPENYAILAMLHHENGDRKKALEALQRARAALDTSPTDPDPNAARIVREAEAKIEN